MDNEDFQQSSTILDGVTLFSNFDSGNMCRAEKPEENSVIFKQYEVYISPDSNSGQSSYQAWFYFGIKGLKKGNTTKVTIMNLNYMKLFTSPNYRPV